MSLIQNRKSGTLPLTPGLGPETPSDLSFEVRSDEETERSRRRSVVTNVQSSFDNVMQETEIQGHLQTYRKMFNENRISVKNVWQLHVIDMMRKITNLNKENVLQIAGSSLDIGAKVYAVRVDDVHAKGLQLASAMAEGTEKRIFEGDEDEPTTMDQTTSQRRRNVRKKTKRMAADKRHIVDKEGKHLFGPIKHVKSVIFATKENVDVGATDNLFTCRLLEDPGTHQFMQMSEDKFWPLQPDTILKVKDQTIEIELPQIAATTSICNYFKYFEIGQWNVDEEEATLSNSICDENGLPLPELEGSFRLLEENCDDNSEQDEDQDFIHMQIQQLHGDLERIIDAVPEEHRIQNDYGYNSLITTNSGQYIDKVWAGPSHWKVKFNKRSAARFTGVAQPMKQSRKVKVPQVISFEDEEDSDDDIDKFVIKKAPPTNPFDKITLPAPDLCKLSNEYLSKSNVPIHWWVVPNKPQQVPREVSEAYNDNIPNDSNCSSQNDNQMSVEEEVPAMAQQRFLGENMVAAPELVQLQPVKYNLHQKKMNMKKLKAVIWTGLRPDGNDKVENVSFSDVYNWLPSQLPSDMRKELSFPLAMVALLHLCNEKSLLLDSRGANDFGVRS